ncbi:MAG: Beta-lactamase class C-like and penicillin binding proteins (PBPs) superfamily [Rhodanobacteraceae bacterium]|jgi:CubicO group peptidase (beta-lactamase class C family)|nr:MAG: Beta-lactamase class C-like and penicillin binding proteins (PBPs) superfamily [Rhodanobacteraceae bacterium]
MLKRLVPLLLAAAACVPCFAIAQTSLAPAASAPPAAATSSANPALPVTDTAPAATAPTLDAQDLHAFLDGLVPYMLKRNDIAGGVVAVVKDGQLIFAQGYGYADVAKRTPVVADKTLFRIGSVSKLFTWTAVMQLVAANKLDLDTDINKYLDFKIPEKFGKPITLRDLMTMTPGFAEGIRDLIFAAPRQPFPLRQYLIERMPPRIFPPGEVVAYSNYGATLAGYIVQRVSGEPFDQYVEVHILKPLQMAHSTFVQPLPSALAGDLATGYITATGKTTVPFEIVEPYPAGSFTSSATDMAKFMIAQLQEGQFDGASILPPATVQLMHSPHYNAAPDMNGYDFGFYRENRNGLRIIGHGGDTLAFHSDLHLLLDKNVGLFMSFNSAGKAPNGTAEGVRTELFRAFLDRYFPYAAPAQPTVASAKTDAARVAGWYWASRREESALRLIFSLGQAKVAALPNGEITVSMLKDPSGTVKHWREIGPLLYQEVNGQSRLRFVTNPDGSIKWWTTDDFPPVELFQPVHGLQQHGWFVLLTNIAIAVFVLTVLVWIGGAIARRRFGRRPLMATTDRFALNLASRIGVCLMLAVVIGWLLLLTAFSKPMALMYSDFTSWLVVLYVLGVLGILGGIAIVLETISRIVRGPGGWLVRISEFVLGLCALYGIWAIVAYGLANFNLQY